MSMSNRWSLPFRFSDQNLHTFPVTFLRATCPIHAILFDVITLTMSGEEYKHTIHHYAVISGFLLLPLSWAQTLSSAPVLKHSQSLLFPKGHRPSFTGNYGYCYYFIQFPQYRESQSSPTQNDVRLIYFGLYQFFSLRFLVVLSSPFRQ